MSIATNDNEMLNRQFGRWIVLEKAPREKGKPIKWICQCECGTIKEVDGASLRAGRTKSCGCLVKDKNTLDLTNQTFGELIAIEKTPERKDGSVVWKCRCSCGNECLVSAHNLRKGTTRSCGHLIGQNFKGGIDITGQQFGQLITLSPTEERKYNSIVWECQCTCGELTYVPVSRLREGKTKSCGCIARSHGEKRIAELLTSANLPFAQEQTFSTLGRYRFDFYVQDAYLIEFDGRQHFDAPNGSGGWFTEETVELVRKRDMIKNEWCKNNNIPLIRIPYYHLDNLSLEDLILETTKYRVV